MLHCLLTAFVFCFFLILILLFIFRFNKVLELLEKNYKVHCSVNNIVSKLFLTRLLYNVGLMLCHAKRWLNIQLNFSGSNTFGTMKISSRQG